MWRPCSKSLGIGYRVYILLAFFSFLSWPSKPGHDGRDSGRGLPTRDRLPQVYDSIVISLPPGHGLPLGHHLKKKALAQVCKGGKAEMRFRLT